MSLVFLVASCICIALISMVGFSNLQKIPGPLPHPLVEQVCRSLEEDDGWEYVSPTKGRSGCYSNDSLDLCFHFSPTSGDSKNSIGPKIYRKKSDASLSTVLRMLSKNEIALLQAAIDKRELAKVLSARIELLDKKLERGQTQELEEMKVEAACGR